MNNNQKLQQIEKSCTLILEKFSLVATNQYGNVTTFHWYGCEYHIVGWSEKIYNKAVENIQKMFTNITFDDVDSFFHPSVIKLLEQQSGIKVVCGYDKLDEQQDDKLTTVQTEAQWIFSYLDNISKLQTVFIPLEGLQFYLDELVVGDVHLLQNKKGDLDWLINTPELHFSTQPGTDRQLDDWGCYFMFSAEGSYRYVVQLAFQKAEAIVHILNLFLGSCDDSNPNKHLRRQKIGIYGSSSIDDQIFYTIAPHPFGDVSSNNNIQFNKHLRRASYKLNAKFHQAFDILGDLFGNSDIYWLHQINAEIVESMKQQGLDRVVSSFNKSRANSNEDRIRRSISWFSKAIIAEDASEQFVALAIALESLLVGGREGSGINVSWGSITQRLAERTAFLLGNSYESRMRIYTEVKAMYNIRSKIVHEGLNVERKDLKILEDLARKSILAFVQHDFTSWEEFLAWEQSQKFNTPQ